MGMKVKLAFWSAVALAVVGAHAPDGALFYFFATHLLAASTGLFMLGLEHRSRAGAKAAPPGSKGSKNPAKTKTK
ncbi:MAG: hypothetical protein R6V84_15710 [Desulfobacterales bacterium]